MLWPGSPCALPQGRGSMNPHPRPRINPLQLPHRPQYPLPHRISVQVARLKHRIRPHGGMGRRVLFAEFAPIRKRLNISTSRRP